jgi:serine/threonine-protein kinase
LYASPEQLSEEGCSYYTDVYQLALVMFEALTGRLPFEISVAGALNYRRGDGPLLLSDEELGEQKLHTDVRNLLEEALERDPQRRTRDMRSFIQKLQDAVCQPVKWSLCANAF